MTEEKKQMLEEVNAAISSVLVGGQSYALGSRRLSRASLEQLYKMKQELEAEDAQENGTGFLDDCYAAVFPWDR